MENPRGFSTFYTGLSTGAQAEKPSNIGIKRPKEEILHNVNRFSTGSFHRRKSVWTNGRKREKCHKIRRKFEECGWSMCMAMNEYAENKPSIKVRIGNFGAKIDRKGQACGGMCVNRENGLHSSPKGAGRVPNTPCRDGPPASGHEAIPAAAWRHRGREAHTLSRRGLRLGIECRRRRRMLAHLRRAARARNASRAR